jgi:hypothetical protein
MGADLVDILIGVVAVAGLAAALSEIWSRDAAIFRVILDDTEAFARGRRRAGRDRGSGRPGGRLRPRGGAGMRNATLVNGADGRRSVVA